MPEIERFARDDDALQRCADGAERLEGGAVGLHLRPRQDLLAGQLAAAVFTVAALLGYVQSGRLRALATTAPQLSPLLPDVPTIRNAGYPALECAVWLGILVPAATPADIVASLNVSVRRSLESDAVKAGLARQALDAAGCSPSEFTELMKADTRRWGDLVKDSGFAPME